MFEHGTILTANAGVGGVGGADLLVGAGGESGGGRAVGRDR